MLKERENAYLFFFIADFPGPIITGNQQIHITYKPCCCHRRLPPARRNPQEEPLGTSTGTVKRQVKGRQQATTSRATPYNIQRHKGKPARKNTRPTKIKPSPPAMLGVSPHRRRLFVENAGRTPPAPAQPHPGPSTHPDVLPPSLGSIDVIPMSLDPDVIQEFMNEQAFE